MGGEGARFSGKEGLQTHAGVQGIGCAALGVQELVVENGVIHVPSVDAGGFVICRKA